MRASKQNMYYDARIHASCRDRRFANRDRAADILFVSSDALADYETGKTLPPCDVVQRMIEVYDAPDLRSAHICEYCPIMTEYAAVHSQLSEAALGWALGLQNAQEIAMQFASVARDGRISPNELDQAKSIRAKAVELQNTMEESILAIDKSLAVMSWEGRT